MKNETGAIELWNAESSFQKELTEQEEKGKELTRIKWFGSVPKAAAIQWADYMKTLSFFLSLEIHPVPGKNTGFKVLNYKV
jgi:hypothetical protein